ncbi:MAG TPA: D-aminoacylase [Acidobacteriota bacterium]|jgi:dihydroorotase/N-acyl-D-amino-acid deacylase
MEKILLRGGCLIDGTGAPPSPGDLLVIGDRIAEVGLFDAPADAAVIDCRGLTITPGFIDAHSHSDLQVLENRPEKIVQGVTTEVVGNCGFSPYPAPPDRKLLHDFANGIFCGNEEWGWNSAREYLADVARSAKYAGVASLVGHGSLRIVQAGARLGPMPERDLEAMEQRLSEALSEGASGFSSGLMYSPGASAPFEELERLCSVAARHDKIYTTHMRSYSAELEAALGEQLQLARRTGCRLQISHLQAVGPANWNKQASALEKIEKAKDEGVDVAFDCYPYTAGSTVLTQLLPQWALGGGIKGMLSRLTEAGQRALIGKEILSTTAQNWSDIYVSAVASVENANLVGSSIETIGTVRGCSPVEVVLDLLYAERGAVNILCFNQSEANLKQTLEHPLSIVISDGFYVRGRPHPRLYGTFPTLLGKISRDLGWLTLAQAVHKITDSPARRFKIEKRGRLEPGFFADISIFDAEKVASPANYDHPDLPPVGIRYVFRNGRLMVNNGTQSKP